MNVTTYNIIGGRIKLDCCTSCIRDIDKVIEGIAEKSIKETTDYIDELLALRKRRENNKPQDAGS